MKRLFILLFAMILLLSAAACGSEPAQPAETPSPAPTAAPTPTPAATPEPTPEATPEPTPEVTPEPSPEPTPLPYQHPLTGERLAEPFGNSRPYAVMINNINVAQPQCSTSQCDILYEILAEGTTRMMAVFSSLDGVGSMGSMRSLRPYYLDIATTYDAIMVHAGGSDQAYSDVKTLHWNNIDGVRGPGASAFARDPNRMAHGIEHSLFTTGQKILDMTAELKYRTEHESEDYDYGLRFTENGTPSGAAAETVEVHFGNYKTTTFTYDEQAQLYYPAQYGSDYVDGNSGEKVGFTNVLVLYAPTRMLDNYGRLGITLTGSNEGLFVCGGKSTHITWERETAADRFSYVKADGSPLTLGIGTTYVCVVPTGSEVAVS